MAEGLNTQENLTYVADRILFFMDFATTFLLGSLCLILNGPLIVLLFKNEHFSNLNELFINGVYEIWKTVLKSNAGLFEGFLFLILIFIIGMLMTPIDRVITMVFSYIWRLRSKIFKKYGNDIKIPFTSAVFSDPNYPAFLGWLLSNRTAKLHWEWELSFFYIYWGVFSNIIIFITLSVLLQWPQLSWKILLFYSFVIFLFFLFAAARCDVMARVHQHYKKIYEDVIVDKQDSSKQCVQQSVTD